VLRDLLACGRVPAVRLETVFRQASRSRIVTNAHRIRKGELPELAPAARLAEGVDCVFVPAAPGQVAALGAEWAARRLPLALGVSPTDVQALAPLTRVCQTLNSTLQGRLNPPRGQAERPHGALPLRVGDRLIQTRNNYHLGVFNGDSGALVAIQDETLTVDFGDGRLIEYGPSDALDLDHAYCLTVHRAQGSEWPGVVILLSSSYGQILTRNLLYTALTRARRAVVLIGDHAAIERAVADTRAGERTTGLATLLTAGGRLSPLPVGDDVPPATTPASQAPLTRG
jgi:exodeoxyribonuclease V alpha subunit